MLLIYTTDSFTHFLKKEQQYGDNYCGLLLKLLKIILSDAERSGLEIHPYSNYMESFKQKNSDLILPIFKPTSDKSTQELMHILDTYGVRYKWFLIRLCICQYVSDLLKLTINKRRKAPSELYIDLLQQKRKKAVTVEIADALVLKNLENEFPKGFHK